MDTRNPGEAESATIGAPEAGDRASDIIASTTQDAMSRASAEAQRQKDRAAGEMGDMTESLRHAADALRQDRQAWLASLVERGADELGGFSDLLRGNDLQGVLSRVEAFARSQPALFAGASMAAGFALARVARVAATQGNGDSRSDTERTGQTSTGPSYHE